MSSKKMTIDELLSSESSKLPPSDEWLDFLMSREPIRKMPERQAGKLSENLKEMQQQRLRVRQKLS